MLSGGLSRGATLANKATFPFILRDAFSDPINEKHPFYLGWAKRVRTGFPAIGMRWGSPSSVASGG